MKVALLVDEVPYPPRNGITIPTHQLCEALVEHNVSLEIFVSSDPHESRKSESLLSAAASAYGIPVHSVARVRRGALAGARDEFFRGLPRFANWTYVSGPPDLGRFDVLIASPISTLDVALRARQPHHRIVALINDAYSAVLASDDYGKGSPRAVLAQGIARIRARGMRALEARLLSQVDRIVVQTRKDQAWLRLIGGRKLAEHARIHHNAAHAALFDLSVDVSSKRPMVVFSADLKSLLYQRNLAHLLDIWPEVTAAVPSAQLSVSGKMEALPSSLRERVLHTPGVAALGFVEHVADIYREARLAVAPVYKRYGFINKVAEPVAAGVPVIADASAFNGMEDLPAQGACFVADDPADVVRTTTRLLTDDALWTHASKACRAFALRELEPRSRQALLLRALLD